MRRECTQAENSIIKSNAKNTLIYPSMYVEVKKKMILPLILGLLVGVAIGAALAICLDFDNSFAVEVIITICVIATVEVLFVVINALVNRRSRNKALPGNQYWINGGTFIGYTTYNDESYIVFNEDDARDENGNICCVQCLAPLRADMKRGERILVVYSDSGAYIPLKITEDTRYMVNMQLNDNFHMIDWNQVRKIPHPNVFFIDKNCYQMDEAEVEKIKTTCNNLKHVRALNKVAVGLMGFLFFFIFGIIYIFIVAEVIEEPIEAIIIGIIFLMIIVLLTFGFSRLVSSGRLRQLNKLRYKQKVMFINRDIQWVNNITVENITVYEYEDGRMKLNTYSMNVDILIPKDLPYGALIHKYSKDIGNDRKNRHCFLYM